MDAKKIDAIAQLALVAAASFLAKHRRLRKLLRNNKPAAR